MVIDWRHFYFLSGGSKFLRDKIYHREVNLNNGKLDGVREALTKLGVYSMTMILWHMCLHLNGILGK